jgi:hypothetical protein
MRKMLVKTKILLFAKVVSILCVLFFENPTGLYATDYYVSVEGNNNNDGRISTPWRNINYAASRAQAGDVVYINSGTYFEQVKIANSGRPGAYIRFIGIGPTRPVISGAGLCLDYAINNQYDRAIISATQKSYLIIENLEVQYSQYIGIGIIGDLNNTGSTVTDIIIRKCRTFKTLGSGIFAIGYGTNYSGLTKLEIANCDIEESHYLSGNFYEEALSVVGQASEIFIHDNHVFNIGPGFARGGPIGIDMKVGVKNAYIYGNLVENVSNGTGIYSDGFSAVNENINIYNNIIRNCKDYGISFGAEEGGKTVNSSAYNNLIYGCDYGGIIVAGQGTNLIDNTKIYNNTVYKNRTGSITITGKTGLVTVVNNIFANNGFSNGVFVETANKSNTIIDYNLIWQNVGRTFNDPPLEELNGTSPILSDPMFAWADNGNFRLKPGSPAIDAGNPALAAANDLDGNTRPLGGRYDVGAYEFVPGTNAASIVDTKASKNELLKPVFNIFPNPVDNNLTINAVNARIEMVEIFSLSGKLIHKSMHNGTNAKINFSQLAKGVYVLRVNGKEIQKIVK